MHKDDKIAKEAKEKGMPSGFFFVVIDIERIYKLDATKEAGGLIASDC